MNNEEKSTPLLSVAVSVYNRDKYIARALDSILMQKVNFSYEMVVGDDFSTDDTRKILLTYQQKYPEKFVLLLPEKNQGALNNALQIYKNCKGKYIAILEGDDYWNYEYKLQKQIDFLEENNDYVACFHDAVIENNLFIESGTSENKNMYSSYKYYSQFNKYSEETMVWDIIQRKIIPTASLVFRNMGFDDFFESFKKVHLSLQWALQLYLIKNSKFKYFNQPWSVYNNHSKGITKTLDVLEFNKNNINILKIISLNNFYKKYPIDIKKAILEEFKQILYNKNLYKKSFFLFAKNYLLYLFYNFSLLYSETQYFFGLRMKRKKS